MSSLISIDEEERVTTVHKAGTLRADRDPDALAVSDNHENVHIT